MPLYAEVFTFSSFILGKGQPLKVNSDQSSHLRAQMIPRKAVSRGGCSSPVPQQGGDKALAQDTDYEEEQNERALLGLWRTPTVSFGCNKYHAQQNIKLITYLKHL